MPQNGFRLPDIFDRFPDAVFFIDPPRVLYRNEAARRQFADVDDSLPPAFLDPLRQLDYEGQLALPQGNFLVTTCALEDGRLLLLRSAPKAAAIPAAANIPAQMRRALHALSTTIEQLGKTQEPTLRRNHMLSQSQTLHRLLRLTRQLELAQEGALDAYPMETVSLSSLCQKLVAELRERLSGEALSLALDADPQPLLISGNHALLEQLVLSLLSNAIKFAGLDGKIGIRLHEKNRRALLSIWDDGEGIDRARMPSLFSPQEFQTLPMPRDGSGLDLWLAHQIALRHDGVIMAGNRPDGGAEFTVSFPLAAPSTLRLRSHDQLFPAEDLSPLLIALSDVLPARAYADIWGQ